MTKAKCNLFLISPPKTGSSSLFSLLKRHSSISGCSLKEPYFFSQNFSKGLNYYNDLFPPDNCFYRMEASTTYFSNREVAKLIKQNCQENIKIICVLRNPVERFISQYKHFRAANIIINNEELNEKFKKSIRWADIWQKNIQYWNGCADIYTTIFEAQKSNKLMMFLNNGNYAKHIKNILHYISRNKILFIKYDDFKKDYNETIKLICNFLNIEDMFTENIVYNNVKIWENFASVEDEITDTMLNELKIYYMESNNELVKILDDHFQW
jgi:hypothetical protein